MSSRSHGSMVMKHCGHRSASVLPKSCVAIVSFPWGMWGNGGMAHWLAGDILWRSLRAGLSLSLPYHSRKGNVSQEKVCSKRLPGLFMGAESLQPTRKMRPQAELSQQHVHPSLGGTGHQAMSPCPPGMGAEGRALNSSQPW